MPLNMFHRKDSRETENQSDSIDPGLVASNDSMTVLLTGSTGNFGAYILDELLQNQSVHKVYCLNRSKDAQSKQKKAHEVRGLSTSFSEPRVSFITADYPSENLGLSNEKYAQIAREVTIIIHNAWPVDFNRTLSSFKPSIDGMNNILALALWRRMTQSQHESTNTNARAAHILFVSSVGAVSNWSSYAPSSRDKIPEVELREWKLARTGYGQSKLLCERVLARAAVDLDVPVTIVRVGQLAGPVTHGEKGAWPIQEYLPSLIKTSTALKALPKDLGPHEVVDWIPVDIAARVLIEVGVDNNESMPPQDGKEGNRKRKKEKKEAAFFHIVNPRAASWNDILPAMLSFMSEDVQIVSFVEWVDMLQGAMKTSGLKGAEDGSMPAMKLWDTFDNMRDRAQRYPGSLVVTLDTRRSVQKSPSLQALQPVNAAWMELWMRQWAIKC